MSKWDKFTFVSRHWGSNHPIMAVIREMENTETDVELCKSSKQGEMTDTILATKECCVIPMVYTCSEVELYNLLSIPRVPAVQKSERNVKSHWPGSLGAPYEC